MPDYIKSVWLIGAGAMAIAYAKVLDDLGAQFIVVGRGSANAATFESATGKEAISGGLDAFLAARPALPDAAIVATGVEALAPNTIALLRYGVKKILLEKPGGISKEEISEVSRLAVKSGASVFVAYNRRFYSSVQTAIRMIETDGGVTSYSFDFTERANVIANTSGLSGTVLNNWFLCNSTHVVDMAFFLGSPPKSMSCFSGGGLSWHPKASVFSGAGIAENGALFSFHSNWESGGRWGVEINTARCKYIFRPLETLQIQLRDSFDVQPAEHENSLDTTFKPGLYMQTKTFLQETPELYTQLKTIDSQLKDYDMYESILKG